MLGPKKKKIFFLLRIVNTSLILDVMWNVGIKEVCWIHILPTFRIGFDKGVINEPFNERHCTSK